MSFLSLIVRLGADNSGFKNALKEGEQAFESWGNRLRSNIGGRLSGIFSLAAITTFTKSVIDLGSHLSDLSAQVGTTVGEIQALGVAAKQDGVDTGDLTMALGRLARASVEAQETTKRGAELLDVFQHLGITLQDLQTLSTVELFRKMGEHMETMSVDARVVASSMEIFGKSGQKMIPVLQHLRSGSGGVAVFSEEEAAALDKMGDTWTKLVNNAKVFAGQAMLYGSIGGLLSLRRGVQNPAIDMEKAAAAEESIQRKREREALDLKVQQNTMEEIAKLQEEAAEITEKARINALSTEERLLELTKRRKELEDHLSVAKLSPERRLNVEAFKADAEVQKELAEVNLELQKLEEERLRKITKRGLPDSTADSLSRIGIYLASGQNPQITFLRESNRLLAELVRQGRERNTVATRDIFK